MVGWGGGGWGGGWCSVVGGVTIRPSTMVKLSLMTLASGARQLVVQEALLWRPEGVKVGLTLVKYAKGHF